MKCPEGKNGPLNQIAGTIILYPVILILRKQNNSYLLAHHSSSTMTIPSSLQCYTTLILLLSTCSTYARRNHTETSLHEIEKLLTVSKKTLDPTLITDDTSSSCSLSCLNDGYCTFVEYQDYPVKGDFGYYQACACRPGFHGGQCELIKEECTAENGYTCNNGAPCEKSGGELVCDCSFADKYSTEAGEMCRETTIAECDTRDANVKSYCANGGVCLSSNRDKYEHLIFNSPST
jgi:hypothetical protein